MANRRAAPDSTEDTPDPPAGAREHPEDTPHRRAALRRAHEAHAHDLLQYVHRLTGDPVLAQDLVQEAFLRAWTDRAILEAEEEGTRAWLFTVARRLVIDDRRSARRRWECGSAGLDARPAPDPSGHVVDTRLVLDALASLSPAHRRTVLDRYWLGLSVAQIADRESIPSGTVKSRLHHALRALAPALRDHRTAA